MTEKGKLRQVWTTDELNAVLHGRSVRRAVRLGRGPAVAESAAVARPRPEDREGDDGRGPARTAGGRRKFPSQFQWLLLTTLGPGRACAVRVVRPDVGGDGRVRLPRPARRRRRSSTPPRTRRTAANQEQWFSPTVSFTPTFLVAVRGEPGADGASPWRMLIGRGEPLQGRGKYNTRVGLHPLLIDPDSGTAEVPDYTVTQRQQAEFASAGGAVLFVEKNMTRPGTFQFRRVGFPGTDKETTAPRVAAGPVVAHDGRVRIVTDVWWLRDRDGKAERKPPSEAHWFRGFAPSSHYGLAVVAELGGPPSLCAVEFADLPP